MSRKIAYITGSTGCVGRNILNELLERDWDIVALHRKSSDTSELQKLGIKLKLIDPYSYESVFASIDPGIDCFFHAAGNVSHWRLERKQQMMDNVLFTKNLVKSCLRKRVGKFIFTSTAATFGFYDPNKVKKLQYIYSKRLAEIEVENGIRMGLRAIIMQPCVIVGKYDRDNYSKLFSMIKNESLPGVLPGIFNFCHAKSVAIGHILAFEKGKIGAKYILGGEISSWLNFFQIVAKRFGVKGPKKESSLILLYIYAYFSYWKSLITRKKPLVTPDLISLLTLKHMDVDELYKAERDLGYKSLPLETMIEECCEEFEKRGLL